MKDGDQLNSDFAAMLICGHGEQKPRAWHGDPIAFWGINKAFTERLESFCQRVQEQIRVQQSLDFRFIQHQGLHMNLRIQ